MGTFKILSQYRKLLGFLLIAILSLVIGLVPSRQAASWLLRHTSYYLIGILFILWCSWVGILYRKTIIRNLKQHYPALILSICLTVFIFTMSPPRFKILADETNLMGVALLMHQDQEAALPIECIFDNNQAVQIVKLESKRPFLFPFMVSLLHDACGYRPSHGFVFNFIVSIGVLFGMYLVTTHYRPRRFGLLAMVLTAGTPIYVICITSGGFEPLNVLLVVYSLYFFVVALQNNAAPRHVELFFFTLLLLAHCRYESVILIPAMGIVLLPTLLRHRFFKKMSYINLLMPLFLLPILWQRMLFANGKDLLVRTGAQSYEMTDAIFKINNLIQNWDKNLFVLMGLNPDYGFSACIFGFALIGLYLFIRRRIHTPDDGDSKPIFIVSILTFCILYIVIGAFHWGNFTIPVDNRLALVFLPFLVWGAVVGLDRIGNRLRGRWLYAAGLLAILHFIYLWPYGAKQRLINSLSLTYEYQQVCRYLSRHFPQKENLILITEQPNMYVIHQYNAIQFASLNQYLDKLDFSGYKHIIAVHKIVGSNKNTAHAKLTDRPIDSKRLTVIPVSKEVAVLMEEWKLSQ